MAIGQMLEGRVSNKNAPVHFDKSFCQQTAAVCGHAAVAALHWFGRNCSIWIQLSAELALFELFPADYSWNICIYVLPELIHNFRFQIRQMSASIHENPAYLPSTGSINVIMSIVRYVYFRKLDRLVCGQLSCIVQYKMSMLPVYDVMITFSDCGPLKPLVINR